MKSVLLIDDDDLVTRSVSKVLKLKGYDVVVSESGEDALKKADEREYDIVLSDIRMPGMSGVAIIKKIDGKAKKVLLMTGYAEEYPDRFGVPCLMKPFGIDDLLAHITV